MKITETKKNPLLHREEITAVLESAVTPSESQVVQMIAESTKKPSENIVIEQIKSNFGTQEVKIKAKIYDNQDHRKRIEVVTRKAKKKAAEEAKKAAEAAKVEVKAEA